MHPHLIREGLPSKSVCRAGRVGAKWASRGNCGEMTGWARIREDGAKVTLVSSHSF